MKINDTRITLLVNEDKISIRVRDDDAATTFLELSLTPEQFAQALSRQVGVRCDSGEVYHPYRLGKLQENKRFTFPLPKDPVAYGKRAEVAYIAALEHCPEGWTPDKYFGSQGSFYTKDEEPWARCTIRRWVERED